MLLLARDDILPVLVALLVDAWFWIDEVGAIATPALEKSDEAVAVLVRSRTVEGAAVDCSDVVSSVDAAATVVSCELVSAAFSAIKVEDATLDAFGPAGLMFDADADAFGEVVDSAFGASCSVASVFDADVDSWKEPVAAVPWMSLWTRGSEVALMSRTDADAFEEPATASLWSLFWAVGVLMLDVDSDD